MLPIALSFAHTFSSPVHQPSKYTATALFYINCFDCKHITQITTIQSNALILKHKFDAKDAAVDYDLRAVNVV